jgi:hypothetical protein
VPLVPEGGFQPPKPDQHHLAYYMCASVALRQNNRWAKLTEFIKPLLSSLGYWGTILILTFLIVSYFLANVVSNAPTRASWVKWLSQDTPGQRDRALLTRVLDALDRRLSRDEAPLPKNSAGKAWSAGLLSFNLVISLGYPVLFLLISWVITGKGHVGNLVLFTPEPNILKRYVMGVTICGLALVFVWAGIRLRDWLHLVVQFVAVGLLILSISAFAPTLAMAGIGVFLITKERTFTIAGIGAITIALISAFSGAFSGAFAGKFANEGISAIAIMATYTFGFIVVDAFAVAVELVGIHAQKRMWANLFFALLSTVAICGMIHFSAGFIIGRSGVSVAGVVLFTSLLPMLNALADFASCGLTRYWMRKGVAGNLLWAGLRDTVAGAVIFILLGFAAIAAIHYVRPQDGVPLADLQVVFDALRNPDQRANYAWLAAMLFATLIPTLVHLTLTCISFFTLASDGFRMWIVAMLESGADGHDFNGKLGKFVLVSALTFAIFIPMLLVWYLFTSTSGVLDAAINVFDWFAVSIGAITPKV